MISIAVCDDQLMSAKFFVGIMKSYLTGIDAEYNIDTYDDEIKMLNNIRDNSGYDIYILDIEMPVQGDRLLTEIRRYDDDFVVAFLSNYDNMGNIVCRSQADAYIYKSMDKSTTLSEIKRLIKIHFYNKQTCPFKTASGIVNIEARKIKYIESKKREVTVHTLIGEDVKLVDSTLSSLEHNSDFNRFARVGRSYLINYRAIDAIRERSIIFCDGEELHFSRDKIRKFKEDWKHFLLKGLRD